MLQKWFERNGFSITLCSGMAPAQEALSKTGPYDVILSDLRLPDGDGILLLTWLNEKRISTPVMIMTAVYRYVSTPTSLCSYRDSRAVLAAFHPSTCSSFVFW